MKGLKPEKILTNKYNHLLIALILLFILSPSMEVRDPTVKFPLAPCILLIVLLTAVRADFPRGNVFRFFLIFALVNFSINMLVYFLPEPHIEVIGTLKFISGGISVLFYLASVYFLSKRLFTVRKVTVDTIKGGISAYLLLGFAWAVLYGLLVQIYPEAFIITSNKEMMYVHFSFTTLTTLGYGDIVPNGRFAALLTNSEAIVGQLYLTIFVARLVGLYIVNEREDL
ncbi:MAG: two pore domain potassium channel family protein [Alphaproteobacteria bacterium]|nr:two pore domain potassium channel family protein [Alphaproteobacteria bacterium]